MEKHGIRDFSTFSRSLIFFLLTLSLSLALFAGSTSTYLWRDELGEPHILEQGEGLEQGDSLAPALYALAQHRALAAAAQVLPPTATLAAFLDDLYILCPTPEARSAYNTVTRAVAAHAGVSANQGKTRIYGSLPQAAPANLADLGPAVWCSDREPAARGFVVGTPLGSPEYIAAHLEARLQEHQHLLDELPQLPDLQSAWLLLTFCAAPRAQHSLRTIPPSATTRYATAHDTAIAGALAALFGESNGLPAAAQELAFLPTRLGGLGLCSATRTKEAAYWAAWADLLPVIHARAPALAQDFVTQLENGPAAVAACLQQADQAGRHLDLHGWAHRPPWTSLIGDAAPPPPLADREPAWWRHGWQHPASVAVTTYHRQECVLPSLPPNHRALLRSQAGPGAGAWLLAVPSDPGTTLPPPAMNIALRRRLRLPLPVTAATCVVDGRGHGCGGPLDPYGDHALACPRSGALARRAPLVERAWVRVAREAVGADGRVVPQQWIASLNLPGVSSTDRRRLDLVIYGATPLGEALCCDATLVSALTRGGAPIPRAADNDAVAIATARQRKQRAYPELLQRGAQRLLVLATELGGRWSGECRELMRILVDHRASRVAPAVRPAARNGWLRRWWGILSVAVQHATALGCDCPEPRKGGHSTQSHRALQHRKRREEKKNLPKTVAAFVQKSEV